MENIKHESFEGKTIKSIDTSCVNVIHFHFTDGSSVSVWSEPVGNGLQGFKQTDFEEP